MKIPLELIEQISKRYQAQDVQPQYTEILKIENHVQFCQELIKQIQKEQEELTPDITTLAKILDRLDDYLETSINQLKEQVEIQQEDTQKIQILEESIIKLLETLNKLVDLKYFSSLFISVDRLVQLVQYTTDFNVISQSFQILYGILSNQQTKLDNYKYIEPYLPKLIIYTSYVLLHQNIHNPTSITLPDIFYDDPLYNKFKQDNNITIAEQNSNTQTYFEYNNNNFNINLNNDYTVKTSKKRILDNPKTQSITFSSYLQNPQVNNFYRITQDIIQQNNIPLDDGGIIIQDALLFRVRLFLNQQIPAQKEKVIEAILSSIILGIVLRRISSNDKTLNELLNNFITSTHIMQITKEIMSLFTLKLTPNIHTMVVQAISKIIQVDIRNDYREIINQITNQYGFLQKLFKDCCQITLTHQNFTFKAQTLILPEETVLCPKFFNNVLDLVAQGIKQFFTDEETLAATPQIYQIQGIVTGLLNVIEAPIVENHSTYTIDSLQAALNILWHLISNQDIVRDFNIMDKLIDRIENDLKYLLDDKVYLEYQQEQWKPVESKKLIELISQLLKLLDSPFFRRSNRVQMAPTLARKIADSNVLKLIKQFLSKNKDEKVFVNTIILVADIAREIPALIDRLIDQGIIDVLLSIVQNEIPRDYETIPMLIYFVNMIGLNAKGFQLQADRDIIRKLFSIFIDPEYIKVFSLGKLSSNFANEIIEMTNSAPKFKESIVKSIIYTLTQIADSTEKYSKLLFEDILNKDKEQQNQDINQILTQNSNTQKILQNFFKFFGKLFGSNSNIIDELFEGGVIDLFLRIISLPVLVFLEYNTAIKSIQSCFKAISVEQKNRNLNLHEKLYSKIIKELKDIEDITGQKLSNLQDLSVILKDDICYTLKSNNTNNLEQIISNIQQQTSSSQYNLIGKFAILQCLIEFYRMSHTTETADKDKILRLMNKFGDIYKLLMKQIIQEDQKILRKNLENSKEQTENQFKELLQVQNNNNKLTLYTSIKKYIILGFKLQAAKRDKPDLIEEFGRVLLKIIDSLKIDEYPINSNQQLLQDIIQTNSGLFHLLEFNSILQEDTKKVGVTKPQIALILHQFCGYDKIMQSLYQYIKLLEKVDLVESTTNEQDNFIKKLIKLGVSQIAEKYTSVLRCMLFIKVDVGFTAYINGKQETGSKLQEYINFILLDSVNKFQVVFQQLPNITQMSVLIPEIKQLIEVIFDSVKRMFSIQKLESSGQGVGVGVGNVNIYDQGEGLDQVAQYDPSLIESVVTQLIDMGFPEQRAQRAVRNIEFPEVGMAMEWLLQHQDEEEEVEVEEIKTIQQQLLDQTDLEQQIKQDAEIYKLKVQQLDDQLQFGKNNVLQPLNEESLKTQLTEATIHYTKTLLINVFNFESYDKFIADLLIFLLDKSPDAADPKRTEFNELAYILLSILNKTFTTLYPSAKLKYSIKIGKTPRAQSLESLIKPYNFKTEKQIEKIKSINVLLPLLIKVIIKIYMNDKIRIKSQFGFEYINITELLLKHIELLINDNDDETIQIVENFLHKIVVLIEELLIIKEDKENDKEKEKEKEKEDKKNKKTRTKKISNKKNEENKTESENESSTQLEEKLNSDDLKQCALLLALDILSTNNKITQLHNKKIINKYSLQGILQIITRCVDQTNDNVKLFIEKKGLSELMQLKNTEFKFDGLLEVFWRLCEALISDISVISGTIECQIKKLFYDEQQNQILESQENKENNKKTQVQQTDNVDKDKDVDIIINTQKQIDNPPKPISIPSIPLDTFLNKCAVYFKAYPDLFMEICQKICLIHSIEIPKEKKSNDKEPEKKETQQQLQQVISLREGIDFTKLCFQSPRNLQNYNKKSKKKEVSGELNKSETGSNKEEQEINEQIIAIQYTPRNTVQFILHTLVEEFVQQYNTKINQKDTQNLNQNDNLLINYDVLLKTIHLLLFKYPILLPTVLKQNCSKLVIKSLQNDIFEIKQQQIVQNGHFSFLQYLIRVVLLTSYDKLRHILVKLCLDNSLLYQVSKQQQQVQSFACEIRRKILTELSQVLEQQLEKPENLLISSTSIRSIIGVGSLLVAILPLKSVCKLAIRCEENQSGLNLVKTYVDTLKKLGLSHYYIFEQVLPFVIEPLSILIQYSGMSVLNKNLFNIKTDDGGDPLRGQKGRDRKDKTHRNHKLLMPFITIKNTSFKQNWINLINLGSQYINQQESSRLLSAIEEEIIDIDGGGGPLDIIDQGLIPGQSISQMDEVESDEEGEDNEEYEEESEEEEDEEGENNALDEDEYSEEEDEEDDDDQEEEDNEYITDEEDDDNNEEDEDDEDNEEEEEDEEDFQEIEESELLQGLPHSSNLAARMNFLIGNEGRNISQQQNEGILESSYNLIQDIFREQTLLDPEIDRISTLFVNIIEKYNIEEYEEEFKFCEKLYKEVGSNQSLMKSRPTNTWINKLFSVTESLQGIADTALLQRAGSGAAWRGRVSYSRVPTGQMRIQRLGRAFRSGEGNGRRNILSLQDFVQIGDEEEPGGIEGGSQIERIILNNLGTGNFREIIVEMNEGDDLQIDPEQLLSYLNTNRIDSRLTRNQSTHLNSDNNSTQTLSQDLINRFRNRLVDSLERIQNVQPSQPPEQIQIDIEQRVEPTLQPIPEQQLPQQQELQSGTGTEIPKSEDIQEIQQLEQTQTSDQLIMQGQEQQQQQQEQEQLKPRIEDDDVENLFGEPIQNQQQQQPQQQQQQEEQQQQQQQFQVQVEEEEEESKQQEDVYQSTFDFQSLGFPADTLKKHNIDPTYFDALPEDMKMDLLFQVASGQTIQQENTIPQEIQDYILTLPENERREIEQQYRPQQQTGPADIDFPTLIATMPPDIREEALLTADQSLIDTLPPDVQAEAQTLRERRYQRQVQIEDQIAERNARVNEQRMQQLKSQLQRKELRDLHKDKFLIHKLYLADDKLIEAFVRLFYTDNRSFVNYPYALTKTLCFNPVNEYKFLDCLLFILRAYDLPEYMSTINENQEQVTITSQFPPVVLQERNTIIKNYKVVYSQITLKILHFLERYTQDDCKYFLENQQTQSSIQGENTEKKKDSLKPLQSIAALRQFYQQQTESIPLYELVQLLIQKLFEDNVSHLQLLISVIYNIVKKSKIIEGFNENAQNENLFENMTEACKLKFNAKGIECLCYVLSTRNIDDSIIKKVSNIISILCLEKHNLDLFIKELKNLLVIISSKINIHLEESINGLKKLVDQILGDKDITLKKNEKIDVKRVQNIKYFNEIMNISKIDQQIDDEKKLFKIFKIIKQIFEKSVVESTKSRKEQQKEQQKEEQEEEEKKEIENQKKQEIKEKDIIEYELYKKSMEEIRKSFHDLLLSDDILNNLWLNITEFLSLLNEWFQDTHNLLNPITQKLQPILESFFIMYKILSEEEYPEIEQKKFKFQLVDNQQIQKKQQPMISELLEEGLISDELKIEKTFSAIREESINLNQMFSIICSKNKKVINMMIKQNLAILSDSLSVVIKKMPKILDFENKRSFFKSELKKLKAERHVLPLSLRVKRNEIFLGSFSQLSHRTADEMRGKLDVQFIGEEGIDAGGLTREWYLLLSRAIFNAGYALFKDSATGGTFQPSPQSYVNPDHLSYFKFVGRIIGKALHDGYQLDAFFTRSMYKHMIGQQLSIHDMEDIDPVYYKNLKWILENDPTPLDLTFSYETDEFGKLKNVDLIPDGHKIQVTNDNKSQYVREMCYARMARDIKQQIEALLEGFHELIPQTLISIFDARELELMISGLPDIDIQDLKENTEYYNYSDNSIQIKWLWEILEDFDQTMKAAFLQFVTGTSKVPLEGFSQLRGISGVKKFNIQKAFNMHSLPTSHTCFNQLDLPEYPSKEMLLEKIVIAITEGKEGFGFA